MIDNRSGSGYQVLRRWRFQGSDGAVHEVVLTEQEADFRKLPVHLQHGEDGGPYISASLDFARDPANGWTNTGWVVKPHSWPVTTGHGGIHALKRGRLSVLTGSNVLQS